MASRVLLVASSGGHLQEMLALRDLLVEPDAQVSWATFESPQSGSALAGNDDVVYLPRVGSRGYFGLLRCLWPALALMYKRRPDTVYSTGAGVALAFLPFAWAFGARAVYIESAARATSPSVTGRILRLLPWIALRTQYRSWATRRWTYQQSVFDGYVCDQAAHNVAPSISRLVVTLGTQVGFPFVSAVRRIRAIVPAGVEVRWQVGPDFPAHELPAGARDLISAAELASWLGWADAVIAHAGVGSALNVLNHGRVPVLLPRSASRAEHVDDHQAEIAAELRRRHLAVVADPGQLTWEHIVASTNLAVRPCS